MYKIERLRNKATSVCENRGHVLDRFERRIFKNRNGDIVRVCISHCVRCYLEVIVVDKPESGEEISGDAYTNNCKFGSVVSEGDYTGIEYYLKKNKILADKREEIDRKLRRRFEI